MNGLKVAGIILMAAGILGLVFSDFTYTKETHDAQIGPIQVSVKDRERVRIPLWVSASAIVLGGSMLVVPRKA